MNLVYPELTLTVTDSSDRTAFNKDIAKYSDFVFKSIILAENGLNPGINLGQSQIVWVVLGHLSPTRGPTGLEPKSYAVKYILHNDLQTFLKKSLKRYTCIYVPSCQRVKKVTSP